MAFLQRILGWYQSESIKYGYVNCYRNNSRLYFAVVTIFPGYFPFTAVYFETAAIIITLILIGRLLETKTKDKASGAVRKL
ncbi:MAG: hypothetical protein P0116_12650 [Candidatus Nitrosocosmicus sp.]|nr:hypothetical protein [Candidatus Nitrosocosmicus sp.]